MQEVLKAIQELKNGINSRFDDLEYKLSKTKTKVKNHDSRIENLEEIVAKLIQNEDLKIKENMYDRDKTYKFLQQHKTNIKELAQAGYVEKQANNNTKVAKINRECKRVVVINIAT